MRGNTRLANMQPEERRKLGVAVAMLCAFEAAAILLGMHGLLFGLRSVPATIVSSMIGGQVVENWLLAASGHGPELSEERITGPVMTAIGMSVVYAIPPFINIMGLFTPWSRILSILAFLALMSRIAWILSRPSDPVPSGR